MNILCGKKMKRLLIFMITTTYCMDTSFGNIGSKDGRNVTMQAIENHRQQFKKYVEKEIASNFVGTLTAWIPTFIKGFGAAQLEGADAERAVCLANYYFTSGHPWKNDLQRLPKEEDLQNINNILQQHSLYMEKNKNANPKNELARIAYEKNIDNISDKQTLKSDPEKYVELLKKNVISAEYFGRQMVIGLFCRYWLEKVEHKI